MTGQTTKRVRVSRNKGILGQEVLYIKNEATIWALRNSDEKLWGRYSQDSGQTWQEWLILIHNYNGYFSFTISGNMLHLTCKNSRGYLVYLCWQPEKITVDILDQEWIAEERVTYQTILVGHSGVPNMIFFTENPFEELWRIKHCFKSAEKWSLPQVIDQGLGTGQSQGAAALDFDGIIHLVYQTFFDHKSQFVYRNMSPTTNSWSNKTAITDSTKSNLYPCLVVDSKGTLHLTWVRSDGMNYRVFYRQKTRGGWMVGGWQREQCLSLAGFNAYNPTISVLENKVTVLWQQTAGIYQCKSFDEGRTFNEPMLEERYQKLVFHNLVSIDTYKKQGLSTIETFDTGSTAIALLATILQGQEEREEEQFLHLPELIEGQELILPNMDYLNYDYGQQGLKEHLQRINGNFQRLFFETEDVRLTNLQMKETIFEEGEKVNKLTAEVAAKEIKINNLKEKERSLQMVVGTLKDSLQKSEGEQRVIIGENKQLKDKVQKFTENKENLRLETEQLQIKINDVQDKNSKLLQLVAEKEKKIAEINDKFAALEEEYQDLQRQLLNYQQSPFWKKFFLKKN